MSAKSTPARRQIGIFSIPEDRLPAGLLRREAIEKAKGPRLTPLERELLDELVRSRSLLVTAEAQFTGEFQRRVRASITRSREVIAKADGSAA
jgi:hypothetical protein